MATTFTLIDGAERSSQERARARIIEWANAPECAEESLSALIRGLQDERARAPQLAVVGERVADNRPQEAAEPESGIDPLAPLESVFPEFCAEVERAKAAEAVSARRRAMRVVRGS